MSMLIIRHKVNDYGKWRPAFDSHSAMRRRRLPRSSEKVGPPAEVKSRRSLSRKRHA